MPYIATYLNWKQYWKFRELAEKLDLTDYGNLKKMVLWMLKNYKTTDFTELKV